LSPSECADTRPRRGGQQQLHALAAPPSSPIRDLAQGRKGRPVAPFDDFRIGRAGLNLIGLERSGWRSIRITGQRSNGPTLETTGRFSGTEPGLHDRALLLVDSAAARARPPGLQTCQIVHHSDGVELLSSLGQDRSGRARQKVGCRSVAPIATRSRRSTPGSRPRRLPRARSSGGSGACLLRAERRASGRGQRQHVTGLAAPIRSH
jgi:hypothetical protein